MLIELSRKNQVEYFYDSSIPYSCAMCGNPLIEAIPEGENRLRAVCPRCGHIHYVNPLPVCGTIPVWEDKVLLCLRAIEPRRNYWTLPGGYLESNESSFDGAIRETEEEACARVLPRMLFTVIDVPFADQIHFFYLSDLNSPDFAPGPESLECRLFKEEDIPWDQIAFPTITRTLRFFFDDRRTGLFRTHHIILRKP
jgi:ADP-ribose pyrophosphatase YjhB (NUDIX family)